MVGEDSWNTSEIVRIEQPRSLDQADPEPMIKYGACLNCENAEHTRSGLFHLSQIRSSVWSLHCKAVANYNSQVPFYNTVKQWRTLQKHALTSVDLPNTEFSLSSSFITEALLNSL